MNAEGFNTRLAKLTLKQDLSVVDSNGKNELNINVCINVVTGLAMLIIDPKLIADTTLITPEINTAPALADVDVGIIDGNTGDAFTPDRYMFMTAFTMPITHNVIRMYYDVLYKDIIIIPDLRFFSDIPAVKGIVSINAQRLGDMGNYISNTFNPSLSAKQENAIALPKPKGNLEIKITHNVIPGYYNRSGNNNDVQSEHQLATGPNLYRWEGSPVTIVNLGKFSDIFEDTVTKKLPLFTIFQKSPEKYDMLQLALGDPKDNEIYIMVRT